MLISELENLEDVMDTLVFEDEPTIFTEEYALELFETAFKLMYEYIYENPTIVSEPNFDEILLDEIKEIFYVQLEEQINKSDYIEDDLNDLLDVALNIFIATFHLDKPSENNSVEPPDKSEENNDIVEKKIQMLRNIPQPLQRTPEWYVFRWNLITASNAWKAFESQPTINQLIYEKCQPIKSQENNDEEKTKMVNVNTPLHWGQKYEPLSILLYERDYNAQVEDFGCIQHPKYKFLGASPDGIIVNKNSNRFGRMLEIKNVVSREITGIPKKEYWIQMQLQMEVCDLNECDFLETKFIEYPDRHSYESDTRVVDGSPNNDDTISSDGKHKGIIIYFHTKEGKPFYIYKPLNLTTSKQILEWEEDAISLYQSDKYNYTFLKFIYWKLEVFSCVLVLRKREWFEQNVHQLENVWKTIEEERLSGYEHRAPNKKPKKEALKSFVDKESQGCLLKFNKIIKIDTETYEKHD